MAKKGPLSKIEAFYAEEQRKLGKSVEDIALDLDRPSKSIANHLDKLNIKPPSNTTGAGKHFVRQSGATIMTENASTYGDVKKRGVINSRRSESYITQAKKEQ